MLRNLVSALALAGLAASVQAADMSAMKVAKGSATAGSGSNIMLQGKPLPLSGEAVVVGKPLPSVMLTGAGLAPVDLTATTGKVRIISVVPSVDTPTCEAQTHELSEKTAVDARIELVTVSMDLPFAQGRFAKEAKISNVTFLSDYKGGKFGMSNGLLIEPLNLLARAVIVTDQNNVVRDLQVVPEITALPDMQEAVKVAKGLL